MRKMIRKASKVAIVFAMGMIMMVTPVMASPYDDQAEAEFAAQIARMERDSEIVRQNKALYVASATALQKKVDKLISRGELDDIAAVTELANLRNSTPDWSSNITVPLTTMLPPRAVLIKTGYRYDDASVGTGDRRAFVWVIEDGELCSCNMSALPEVVAAGGFHEHFDSILNHPTSGVAHTPDGSEFYWGFE